MSRRVTCSKCGHENEMTGIFCRECGEKLDFKNVQSAHFEKGRNKEKRKRSGGGFFRLVRFLVLAALVAIIALMVWPVNPYGEVGSTQQAEEAKGKVIRLYHGCQERQGVQELLNEAELNAYLANLIEEHGRDGAGGSSVQDANLVLSRTGVTLFTSVKVGPLSLTYTLKGDPTAGNGITFPHDKVKVGRLPLPGPVAKFVVGQVGRIFSGMEHEKYVLENVDELELGERRVRLTTP